MLLRRREGPAWRGLVLACVMSVTVGLLAANVPSAAIAANGVQAAAVPPPTDPAPADPTPLPVPSDPAPTPSESAPPPPPEPSPPVTVPSETPPAPDTIAPAPAGPAAPAVTPSIVSESSTRAPAVPAAPTAFGQFYPTNPWIYNGAPGTRYLDPRERDGDGALRLHQGIDAQGGERQPIFAVAAGTVVGGTWGTTTRDRHGYGNQVEIAHADGYATRYAHLAEAPIVQPGEHVAAGQLIGYMGGTQRGDLGALARHLHFEVTKDGVNVDPLAFLTGAVTASGATPTVAPAAADTHSPHLHEVRAREGNVFVSISTGLEVGSNVFTAVDMGGGSAQVMVSEGGTLKQLAVVDGTWTKVDTHLPLNATSISGVNTGKGFPEMLAVEDGKLFHVVGDAAGWTKTWTGHHFTGTVSAVRMPGDQLQAMIQQSGYLYHLYPAQGGLWNVTDTRLVVGDRVDAVYVDGPTPEAMTVIDGEVYRITRSEYTWEAQPTGLPASGSVTAGYHGGGWPVAISAEPQAIGLSRVVNGVWTRYLYGVLAPGPFDAVTIGGAGTVLYSIG